MWHATRKRGGERVGFTVLVADIRLVEVSPADLVQADLCHAPMFRAEIEQTNTHETSRLRNQGNVQVDVRGG